MTVIIVFDVTFNLFLPLIFVMKRLSQLFVLAALAIAPTLGFAQDVDPLADIKKQIKDPAKPFTLIVEFKVKPDKAKDFKKMVREAVKNTRMEPGNAAYQVHADAGQENTLVFFEIWRSVEALEAHVKQEYTKTLLGSAETHCDGKPNIRVLTPFAPAGPGKPKAAETPAPAK